LRHGALFLFFNIVAARRLLNLELLGYGKVVVKVVAVWGVGKWVLFLKLDLLETIAAIECSVDTFRNNPN